jgi:hypothetical protein
LSTADEGRVPNGIIKTIDNRNDERGFSSTASYTIKQVAKALFNAGRTRPAKPRHPPNRLQTYDERNQAENHRTYRVSMNKTDWPACVAVAASAYVSKLTVPSSGAEKGRNKQLPNEKDIRNPKI